MFNHLHHANLHNIHFLCPTFAALLINTFRAPTELFIDGEVLWSQEGTTQGDSLAMPLYAIATIPLINKTSSSVFQVWYTDDATALGSIDDLCDWWKNLHIFGNGFGYFANVPKTWLIYKKHVILLLFLPLQIPMSTLLLL